MDLSTQRVLKFRPPKDANATALSPDGSRLAMASGSAPGDVWVTDIATGEVQETHEPGKFGFTSIAWSPDGKYLAAAGWDASVPVWHCAWKAV